MLGGFMPNIIIEHLEKKLSEHTEKPIHKPPFFRFWQWLYMSDYLYGLLPESQEEKVIEYNDYLFTIDYFKYLINYFKVNSIDQNTINDFLRNTVSYFENGEIINNGTPMESFISLMDELNIEQTWRKS
jgi:hypothetical protein